MEILTKIEAKLLKKQNRAFKKLFNKARTRVRKIKDVSIEDKRILIKDLLTVNLDLMNVLLANGEFKDVLDYLDTINAYCRSEVDCFDYGDTLLVYFPGKMSELMDLVRVTHNNIDRYEELKQKLGLNDILK